MLKPIVTQVSGRITALCTRLWALLATRLWPNVKQLLANITQAFLNVANRLFQLVQTVLNTSRWRVSLTIVVVSIKAVFTSALLKVTQLGQQLLTIALQMLQRVSLVLQQTKDKLAASIKSALSRFKEIGFVQTLMGLQSTQDGEKPKDLVKQRQPRAKQASKKGK